MSTTDKGGAVKAPRFRGQPFWDSEAHAAAALESLADELAITCEVPADPSRFVADVVTLIRGLEATAGQLRTELAEAKRVSRS